MTDFKTLAQWVNILVQDNKTVLSLTELPPSLRHNLVAEGYFKIGLPAIKSAHGFDVILALDVCMLSQSASAAPLTKAIQHLALHGVLLVTTSISKNVHSRDIMSQFLDSISGVKICSTVPLPELAWHCWLVQKTSSRVELPANNTFWEIPIGDVFMNAFNGSSDALRQVHDHGFRNSPYADKFQAAFGQLSQMCEIQSTGWTEINHNQTSLYLISALSTDRRSKKIARRSSGAALSWDRAAFLMICEGIERVSQKHIKHPGLSGIAFGFSETSATLRALLEYFERHYFNQTFLSPKHIQRFDKENNSSLSESNRDLFSMCHNTHLFLLTTDEPFFVILAISNGQNEAEQSSFQFGLGCSFEIEEAIQSALVEVVQTSLYHKSMAKKTDYEHQRMTPQANYVKRYWGSIDQQAYLDNLIDNSQPITKVHQTCTKTVPESEWLQKWCRDQNITYQTEILFRPNRADEGWVVRVTCDGLTEEKQLGEETNSSIPFPYIL